VAQTAEKVTAAAKSPMLWLMPKRKEPELTPEEQFKRFREAAKKAEVDETGKQAEEAFNNLISQPSKRASSKIK
jgi:hypothetical protein